MSKTDHNPQPYPVFLVLSILGIKTPLSKGVVEVLTSYTRYKIYEIIIKSLLAWEKVMFEMHLRQPGFTCSASWPFTKNKERKQELKQTGVPRYIYQKDLNKICFQREMAYGDFKDSTRRIASDKILPGKAFNIAKNPKYDEYQRGLPSMVYNVFGKKTFVGAVTLGNKSAIRNKTMSNKDLAEDLHKPIIRNF